MSEIARLAEDLEKAKRHLAETKARNEAEEKALEKKGAHLEEARELTFVARRAYVAYVEALPYVPAREMDAEHRAGLIEKAQAEARALDDYNTAKRAWEQAQADLVLGVRKTYHAAVRNERDAEKAFFRAIDEDHAYGRADREAKEKRREKIEQLAEGASEEVLEQLLSDGEASEEEA